MWTWMQRNLSMDDLWSFLGYLMLLGVNAVVSGSMTLPVVSLAVAGMLAIMWVVNPTVRARTPHPNARVAFWALVAAVSAVISAT